MTALRLGEGLGLARLGLGLGLGESEGLGEDSRSVEVGLAPAVVGTKAVDRAGPKLFNAK